MFLQTKLVQFALKICFRNLLRVPLWDNYITYHKLYNNNNNNFANNNNGNNSNNDNNNNNNNNNDNNNFKNYIVQLHMEQNYSITPYSIETKLTDTITESVVRCQLIALINPWSTLYSVA